MDGVRVRGTDGAGDSVIGGNRKDKAETFTGPCFFCGGPADTKEDVLPKWYQRHFPPNGMMYLPNGTPILRRQAVVPACSDDNGRFSTIENKIKRGRYSEDEAYLWAFKIHAGLTALDARIQGNRADPTSGPMAVLGLSGVWLMDYFGYTAVLFRRLYKVWRDKGRFRPSPLGSVFCLPSRKPISPWFQHAPVGYVGFNLDKHFLAVALFDGGFARSQHYEDHWAQEMRGLNLGRLYPPPPDPQLFEGFWMAHMAHRTYSTGEGRQIVFTEYDALAVRQNHMLLDISFRDFLRVEGRQFGLYATETRDGDNVTLTLRTHANFEEHLDI